MLVAIISTLLANLHLGHGPWTLFQMLAWTVVALFSYLFGRTSLKNNLFITALFAGFTGLIYGIVVSLQGLQFYSNIIAYYLMGLSHDLSHAMGNFAMYLVFGGRLSKLLGEFANKSS